jgi:hypothetical protein
VVRVEPGDRPPGWEAGRSLAVGRDVLLRRGRRPEMALRLLEELPELSAAYAEGRRTGSRRRG